MPRQKNESLAPRRAALYIRVSTEEQAKQGYSLDAQREDLERYAKEQGYAIVGCYVDEGKSARKKFTSRREFMRMMDDVRAGKIDIILFIKLDRWFRNVADYYKIQEVLDAHNVAWKTTQEQYDTETTNGRLYINIRLSVAQDECDRDSDRIKFVFNSKVAKGEAICGANTLPMGLTVRDKRVVHDPDTAPMAVALFEQYRATGSIGISARYIRETYGIMLWEQSAKRMLHNPLYKGMYRDNPSYCDPLIPPEEFDAIQGLLAARSVRSNPSRRVYLFASLLTCECCGNKMSGTYNPADGKEYYIYRCRTATVYHRCDHRKQMSEIKLEKWLLENIALELDRWETEWRARSAQKARPKTDRAAIQRKMDRLKDLYVNDLITMEQYRSDYAMYSEQMQKAEEEADPPMPDFKQLHQLIGNDLSGIYQAMDRQERRQMWWSIIREIRLDLDNNPHVIFRA